MHYTPAPRDPKAEPVRINLLSDTQTRPTPAMREAMARAEVGDEQIGDDPTVNLLCERVAELLILRPDMPRSLAACMNDVVANLNLVANAQSAETLRRAGRLKSDLQYGRIDEILATGLHAFLTQFLDRVGDLGVGISRDFLVPMAA